MVSVKVRSQWQGMVAIRKKYLDTVLETEEDLDIEHDGKHMIMTYAEADTRKVIMDKPVYVNDKYSGEIHELVYFQWNPNNNQLIML